MADRRHRLINRKITGASAVLELSDLTDVNTSTPTARNVLVADGTDWESRALVEADISDLGNYSVVGHTHTEADITDLQAYLLNIVEDLTPQLGGTLDTNGNLIDSDGGIVALSPTADTTTPILTLITESSNVDRRLINFWEENASGDDGFWLQYSGVPATPGNRLVFGSDKPSAAAEILALGERGQVWIPADLGNDASYSSTDHPFQIGLSSGTNLRMDNNEILAVNNGAASTLFLQGDGGDLNYGGNATSTSKDVDWYLAGGTMRLHSVASASEAEFSWSGTDFQITGASTADDIQFIGWDSVQIRSGMDFFILDAAANSWSQMWHGGTDFHWAFTGTTDMNITGLTAINAGTVDADFDALTATSFGGVASANLVDKSANETITGNWTFNISSIDDFIINRTNTTSEAAIQFANDDGTKGYIGVDDNGQLNFRDAAKSIKLFIDASGNLVADGDISGTTIGGITEANLLDKSATEVITGNWTFETSSIATFIIDRQSTTGESAIAFGNDDGIKGYVGFTDAESMSVRNSATTQVLFIDSSGNLEADGVLRGAASSAATPAFSFTNDNDTGMYRVGTDSLGFSAGGTVRSRIRTTDIQTDVPVRILEAASAPADIATYGTVWVRNDTPNTLMFTDDSGTDIPLSNNTLGEVQSKFLATTTTAKTTDTTLADESDLSGFVLVTGATYIIEAHINYLGGSVPDIKIKFDFTNSPSGDLSYISVDDSGAINESDKSPVATQIVLNTVNTREHSVRIIGSLTANATTGGTMDFQWAQNTSDASGVSLDAGCWIKLTRVI